MLLEKILDSAHKFLNKLAPLVCQLILLCTALLLLSVRISRGLVQAIVSFGAIYVLPDEVVLGNKLVVEILED